MPFLVEIFKQPCKGVLLLSLILQKTTLRHRKDMCRVYTHLVGRQGRDSTPWRASNAANQELTMGLWTEGRTEMGAEGLPRSSLGMK